MKMTYALALVLAAASAPVLAQPATDSAATAPAVTKGAMLFSADGSRLGRIDRIRATSVSLIYNSKIVEVPLSTLTASDHGYTTSLTKKDVGKL